MRTWPALDVGRLKPAPTTEVSDVEAGSSRREGVGADFSPPSDLNPPSDVGTGFSPPSDAGAGFCRPDLFLAALLDFDVAAIDDNDVDSWRVFFHTHEERDRAQQALEPAFPDLSFEAIQVDDEDWAARSQANLKAVRVGSVIVAPPWDIPVGDALVGAGVSRTVVIAIQPSMGFGTGHHATTRLCLAALQQIDLRGRSAVDVGTGSGVLAIAASLLGASRVLALDDDADAIDSARENVHLNPGANVDVQVLDLRTAELPVFDVVLANLTGGLLIHAAGRLQDLTGPNGIVILSGFMTHEEAGVLDAFDAFTVAHRAEEEEWLSVALRRS
jgi:ribosomal protein L11 methyltransferase